ncbi:hypothetical protein TREAZ_1641 [Leadbettera azotonutricia ZAS-9]|uniref:Uncharacterized protein n=1 Tax=Leadbettera azotonutricia (strain ATCC BAA-888 / DSM 13862 / ZAS-9) TaxID=545695 RepID=F5YDB6_LEAAZ|nr:hypothetical protein TREAZ_1641 [Leadbettera azotonutricia ZAS-9]
MKNLPSEKTVELLKNMSNEKTIYVIRFIQAINDTDFLAKD